MINRDDSIMIEQDEYDPPRYKYIGHGYAGIITVITDDTSTRIITAWQASTEKVKLWLANQ